MEQFQNRKSVKSSKSQIATLKQPVPATIQEAGGNARFAWDEFFAIDNENTKSAYEKAVARFLDWCNDEGLTLTSIMPSDVSRYIKQLLNRRTGDLASRETRKLQLSAIRRFFDVLVLRHAIVLNPAASVRGPKISGNEGKTPPIPEAKVSVLLESICTNTEVGLRDRVIIGILLFTAARRGAVANLRIRDSWTDGVQFYLRFDEKGGKVRNIPVRHDLQEWISEYVTKAGLEGQASAKPLLRKAIDRAGRLSEDGVSPRNISDMVKRRFRAAGLSETLTAHSFRATTITNLLSQDGVSLEAVQDLAGHADARTTRRYDHSNRKITRNLVERITF